MAIIGEKEKRWIYVECDVCDTRSGLYDTFTFWRLKAIAAGWVLGQDMNPDLCPDCAKAFGRGE